jgi:hypothetical protein
MILKIKCQELFLFFLPAFYYSQNLIFSQKNIKKRQIRTMPAFLDFHSFSKNETIKASII